MPERPLTMLSLTDVFEVSSTLGDCLAPPVRDDATHADLSLDRKEVEAFHRLRAVH